ncbi:ISAs1 family transposase [Micromonospora sp. DT48]|uniref:ISAs1 family transposase n=1 Tax=Micromonospora sp. DT48 TaxID=3393429 RepID=UPI003CF5E624
MATVDPSGRRPALDGSLAWLRTRTRLADSPSRPRYRQVIAIDGKTLRGARRVDGSQVHLLSALDTSTGIVLAQITVAAKSNDIPAFAPLLDAVEQVLGSLKDPIFAADALHTQTAHATEIAARGAHLLIPVKGNQPTLFTQLKTLPWTQIPVGHQTRDYGHGRRETRTVKAITLHTPGRIGFPPCRTSHPDHPDPHHHHQQRQNHPPPTPNRATCRNGSAASGSSKPCTISGM